MKKKKKKKKLLKKKRNKIQNTLMEAFTINEAKD